METKELVCSYDWSDVKDERQMTVSEIINGREVIKLGRYCATSAVADIYELNDCSSDEPFKYLMLIGIARQHPNETSVSRKVGVDIAATNAKVNPIITMKFQTIPCYCFVAGLIENYVECMPKHFVRTAQEKNMNLMK